MSFSYFLETKINDQRSCCLQQNKQLNVNTPCFLGIMAFNHLRTNEIKFGKFYKETQESKPKSFNDFNDFCRFNIDTVWYH